MRNNNQQSPTSSNFSNTSLLKSVNKAQIHSAAFEETLTKLADMAKSRVKYDEFTQSDRSNLLDLFVNNERTLLHVYEILFPQSSFKQSQILINQSADMIKLNDKSRSGLNFHDSATMATGHGLSLDQVSDIGVVQRSQMIANASN